MVSFLKKQEKRELRKKTKMKPLSPLHLQLIVGAVLICGIALLLTAVWYTTRIASLQIQSIDVIGGETISHALVQETVERTLIGTYFKLVPRSFIPLYPKDEIVEQIQGIDRIKNVHVEITKNQTLTVVFDEYIPFALWCEHPESVTCLFIDATGYAFAPAPELEGSAFVRYVEEGRVPAVDTFAFERSYVEETGAFIELLQEQLSLYVISVSKKGTYDTEYVISGGGILKVSQNIPALETFSNLETILTSEDFVHVKPGAFQYIDLRFGDKVFVNEALPVSEVQASTTATTSNPL